MRQLRRSELQHVVDGEDVAEIMLSLIAEEKQRYVEQPTQCDNSEEEQVAETAESPVEKDASLLKRKAAVIEIEGETESECEEQKRDRKVVKNVKPMKRKAVTPVQIESEPEEKEEDHEEEESQSEESEEESQGEEESESDDSQEESRIPKKAAAAAEKSQKSKREDYFKEKDHKSKCHKWLCHFFRYLFIPDAGFHKNKNRLQHACQVKRLLEESDPHGDDIAFLADEEGNKIWVDWVIPNLTKRKPGTLKSYLMSFKLFLFLVCH